MSTQSLPEVSQTFSWLQKMRSLANPLGALEAQARDHGDIFNMVTGLSNKPTVVISNPEGLKIVFTASQSQLDSGEDAGIKLPLLGQNSLLALSGKRHQRQRKLLMPPFHGERMRVYGDLIRQLTEQVTSQWPLDEPFSVRSSMQEISFEVILKAVFGLDENSTRCQQLKAALLARLNPKQPLLQVVLLLFPVLQQDLGPWSPWGSFLRLRQKMDDLLYAEIKERRSNLDPARTDILSLMLTARDENGEAMTDEELRDELMTLLVAGHETTATSLAWAFYWIHHQRQIREKLLKELDNLGNQPDPMAILKLPYLDSLCKETLRMYPVTPFALPRLVKAPMQIGGYSIKPGTILSPCIYLTHQREDIYPEPKQFRPERFLERQFSPYEYLPFGGGNRRCLGYAFAEFEMKLVLATALSRWQLALADSKPVRPIRQGLLIGPSEGVRMRVIGQRFSEEELVRPDQSAVMRTDQSALSQTQPQETLQTTSSPTKSK